MKKYIAFILTAVMLMSSLMLTSCESSTDLADYNIDKYITLPEYKGVKITETVITVTKDDIADAVDDLLDEHAETVTLEETDTVQTGDVCKITYKGYINGTYDAFEDGELFTEETSGYSLTIGSNALIPGFEDGLIGAHPGDEVQIDLVFPEVYKNNPDLQNVRTAFVVDILEVERDIYPEYTDAFVAENTDYKTVEEYEAYLAVKLREDADDSELIAEIKDVWAWVVENTVVEKYPDAVVEAQKQEIIKSYTSYAEAYSLTLEELLTQGYGTTEEKFLEEVEAECKQYVLEEMILRKIVELENITISDAEYAEGAEKYATDNGFTDAAALEEYYGEETIRESLLWDKVLTFLVEKADIQPAESVTE